MTPLDPKAMKDAGDVCKKCRAPFVWATTANGKPIPIDPEPVFGGNVSLTVDNVGMLRCEVVRAAGDVEAYVAHFASCPAANEFRKPEETDQAPDHDQQLELRRRALLVRMPFGQFEGLTLEEIDREKRGHAYLLWAIKGITWRRSDVRDAIKVVLGVES